MHTYLRRTATALFASAVLVVALAPAAFAVDPTPPADPTAIAKSGLANYGDKALATFQALVTDPWVLALFAVGIGLAFVGFVITRAKHKVSRPLGH